MTSPRDVRLCEVLESRRLCSGLRLSHGMLAVTGAPSLPNTITVGLEPGGATVRATVHYIARNGVSVDQSQAFATADIRSVFIRSGNAIDFIQIDQTNGLFPYVRTVIYAYAGNDTVLGGAEPDYIRGGYGDDSIDGGGGRDTLYGDAGNDTIRGGASGITTIRGGSGNDLIFGGGEYNTIFGDAGNDTIFGGDGGNYVHGGAGNDSLIAGAGRDMLAGDAGNDTLIAGIGIDTLRGGAGRNYFQGGSGTGVLVSTGRYDTMVGGTGPDEFYIYYTHTVRPVVNALKGDIWHRIYPASSSSNFWDNFVNSTFNPWGL